MSTSDTDPDASPVGDVIAELEAAHDRLETLRDELEEATADHDRAAVEAAAAAARDVAAIMDRWEERATDWDDFQGYVAFRNELADRLEEVPADVPAADAFETADGHLKTGGVSQSLSARDFQQARDALAPAREYTRLLEELATAEDRYRHAHRAVRRRRDALADRIADLERLERLGQADLEAPVEALREPIESYNDAVSEAFAAYRRTVPARELLETVATAARRPLVGYDPPPQDLLAYVREHDAGDHPVVDLLEYAGYSRSKLAHYVDDPAALTNHVATNRTYLERLAAAPLTVEWPPPPPDTLWHRADALVPVVATIADEPTVAALRTVRGLARRDDYDRLRTAAEAHADLSPTQRDRVADGTVAADLADAREAHRRLVAALDAHPAP